MKTKKLVILLIIIYGLVLPLSFACSKLEQLTATKVEDILKNPREYEGKSVTVHGTVAESVSLLGFRYFTLRDDTGEIFVVTKQIPPVKGEKFTVKGKVNEAFAIGDRRLIVIVEEDKK